MEILKLLDDSDCIENYEIIDYKHWSTGFYYKLKAIFTDDSVLFAKEYFDSNERNYSFHWQQKDSHLICRWDNAPHHKSIATFPHHKHCHDGIYESKEISLVEILKTIRQQFKSVK